MISNRKKRSNVRDVSDIQLVLVTATQLPRILYDFFPHRKRLYN